MRHKGVNKDEMRKRVTDAVGRGFRKYGFAGAGVDALAKGANVTSGAFYTHFGSKVGAFEVALTVGLQEVADAIPQFQRAHGANWVAAFADYYLGAEHRADLECGCAMASLTPEVVRAESHVHSLFEQRMEAIVDVAAAGLLAGDTSEARSRAWAMLGLLIGGLNLARAVGSTSAAEEIAKATRTATLAAAGAARALSP